MHCPNCGTIIIAGDRFCEECGASLVAETTNPNSIGGCEKCGATSAEIDEEGYCSKCGFRNRKKETDRTEIPISSILAGISDRGFKHHHNEDYLACAKVDPNHSYVLVVCDGVSSSQSPELAAKAAADNVCLALSNAIEKGDISAEAAIKLAMKSALTSVAAIPHINSKNDAPSTTIVAAIVQNRTATIGWLGDSRAYWISPQGSRQLTKDHSWVNDMVAAGEMTEAEARLSPHAHGITRWLGADSEEDWEPSMVKFDIPHAGYLLLCTDGLWNYAPDATQITEIVKPNLSADALKICQGLVDFALRMGGHDNITVALLAYN